MKKTKRKASTTTSTSKAATAPTPPKASPLDRLLAELERGRRASLLPGPPPPPEGADARIRASFDAVRSRVEAGLGASTPEMRELFARVAAYVDEGMPDDSQDEEVQAGLYVIGREAAGARAHVADFTRRWVRSGGLELALRIGLRATRLHASRTADHPTDHVLTRVPIEAIWTQQHGLTIVMWLAPEIAALAPAERARLRSAIEPLVSSVTAPEVAALAIAFDDDGLATEAVRRGETEAISFRDPWPFELLEVLRDGESFAHLLALGAAAFQFFASGVVLRARHRLGDEAVADAIVRVFTAAFAAPKPMQDSSMSKLAMAACAIPHPWLAWLFAEHGNHRWLKKAAPLYSERHPSVRAARPSGRALSAERARPAPLPRPKGFAHEELMALTAEARDRRLIDKARKSDADAAFVMKLLPEYPSPTVAATLHEIVTDPSFSAQMVRPGHHKQLRAELRALAARFPALEAAIAAKEAELGGRSLARKKAGSARKGSSKKKPVAAKAGD